MVKYIMATALMMSAAIANAHAGGDIRVYGGTEVGGNGLLTGRTVTVSGGLDTPRFIGVFSPTSLRADVGYRFASESFPTFPSIFNPAAIDGVNEFDASSFTIHVGPEWKYPLTQRLSFFAGIQIGIDIEDFDSTFTPADPSAPLPPGDLSAPAGFSDTDFSIHLPVGFEYAITERFGLTARYRRSGGGIGSSNAVEAGFSVRF